MNKPLFFLTFLAALLLPACGGQSTAPTLNMPGQPTFVLIYTEN